MNIQPVILCGGAGTRLWPLSRELFPKQLLSLVGENSLLQDTVLRIDGARPPMLICNEDHRFLVAEQLRTVGIADARIVLEPVGRNTAPAVAIAARQLAQRGEEDSVMVVLPSDHVLPGVEAFRQALADAVELALQGHMVTFGVAPTSPETGYGYIKSGDALGKGFVVDQFVEKPDRATAQAWLDAGGYYWNSGMFVFKASRYLEELQRFRPDIYSAVAKSCESTRQDQDFMRPDESAFRECPSDSIDYAVMEKTDKAAMVPLDAGWSDIGSWDALWQASERDANENALHGDVIIDNVQGSYIRAEHRLVSAVGVQDLVIVETADAVMIASRAQAQNVRQLVSSLKSCERAEHVTHRKVYRPWGHYEGVNDGERFQVKHI